MKCGRKEVLFGYYCSKCVHESLDESDEPCNSCLSVPGREGTRKPVKYEPRDGEES